MLSYFLSMMLLILAIASVIAGIFTAYFGSDKNNVVGVIMILGGALMFILFLWGAGVLRIGAVPDVMNFSEVIINGIVAVAGAVIGALIVLGIFILTILKT